MASNPLNVLAQSGEPALNTSRAVSVVGALITVAVVVFGLDLSPEKVAAILGAVVVLAPLVQGYITRSKVFSPKTVAEKFTPNEEVAVSVAPTGDLVAAEGLPSVANGASVAVIDDHALDTTRLIKVGDVTVSHDGGVLIPGNLTTSVSPVV